MEALGTYEDLNGSAKTLEPAVNLEPQHQRDELEVPRTRNDSTIIPSELLNEKKSSEQRSKGTVPLAIYWKYFTSGGGCLSFFLFLLSCIITQFLFAGSDYWLYLWTDAEQFALNQGNHSSIKSPELFEYRTATTTNHSTTFHNQRIKDIDTNTGIYVFTTFTVVLFIFSLIRTIHLFVICTNASINLHTRMFQSVIRAPLRFFEQNDVGINIILIIICILKYINLFMHTGRILNRFTKDLGCVDDILPVNLFDLIQVHLFDINSIFFF